MGLKLHKYSLNDFSGGFSADKNEDAMELGFTPCAYNFEAQGGSLKTVKGYTVRISEKIIYQGEKYIPLKLIVYYSDAGRRWDELLVLATKSGTLGVFKYDSGSWVNVLDNASEADVGFINSYYNEQNNLIICNAVDGLYKYDADEEETTEIEDSPTVGNMALHYERIWAIGDPFHPNTVYYSASQNPEEWDISSDAGEVTVTTFDGDKFIGIENVFDDIVLYRKNSLFKITGSSPASYRLQQIPSPTGAVGRKGIANNGRYSYFVGNNGIYCFDGMKASVLENDRLRLFFENDVNKASIEQSCAVIFNNMLYVALPVDGSAVNNSVIEYDIIRGVFNLRKNIGVRDFSVYKGELVFIDTSGNICTYNDGTKYNSASIAARYETPWYDFERKNALKILDSMYITAKGSGSVKVICISDTGTRDALVTLGGGTAFQVYKVPLTNSGKRLKFAFENVSGSAFEIVRPEIYIEFDEDD